MKKALPLLSLTLVPLLLWIATLVTSCGGNQNDMRSLHIRLVGISDDGGCYKVYLGKERGGNLLAVEWTLLTDSCEAK